MDVHEKFPDWPRPPCEGFTATDLLTLAGLPPHTQLIDGSFVFRSRQSLFHTTANCLLEAGLRRSLPDELRVRREMVVVVDPRQAPEPDLSVIRADAATSLDDNHYPAADVVLVVEVVSPDSEERDRKRKPQLYAEAGIPHFWRVEMNSADERPVVYVFELETATRSYVPTGIYRDHLKLTAPFDIDIDLTEIDNL
ncbi:Uma2 family endonuclease [Streptomyces sp. XD-27]|uniref:Uma2 family endonuclease n=1 Tax=Streptomyces sp. XD-27 TaxID=3062779 RepID=UPI0026F41A75|nr:Uma2 family endonuclease [Streptomyces sp. XD-27]WKX70913.1 Uma2 family endonuclease [Streptomyces sp. XD-27]